MIGPGKYDELATLVRERARAEGAIVVIFAGDKGHGFSMQADLNTTLVLPQLLRHIADQIEADMKGGRT